MRRGAGSAQRTHRHRDPAAANEYHYPALMATGVVWQYSPGQEGCRG